MIRPFAYPTTVGFVDDSTAFLANLSLQLDAALAFRLFSSPTHALRSLNEPPAPAQPAASFFSRYHDRDDSNEAQEVVAMSLDAIRQQVHNDRRFEPTSVVVVDYDMPEMNGLEFCRRIEDPAIRKIILSGKADEHLAVRGFNEGIIDRFIRKQDADVIPALNRAIEDMQSAYFDRAERTVVDALAMSEYTFLTDAAFATRVSEIFRALGIVEHYLSFSPNGLLMLDSQGLAHLLIVHTDETLNGEREIAIEQGAPANFLAELDNRRSLPYFWHSQGHYPDGCSSWQSYMHPATVFHGERPYVYSVVTKPAGFKLDGIVTYDAYLERLDREIQATWG